MGKETRILGMLLAVVLLVGLVSACAQQAPAPLPSPGPSPTKPAPAPTSPKAQWPKQLYMGEAGGSTKVLAIIMADIIKRNVGVDVVVEPLTGSDEGLMRLAKGDLHMYSRLPGEKAVLALAAEPPYEYVVKGGFRWIFNGYASHDFFVVRAESGIKSLTDMKGKRITIGGAKNVTTLEAFLAAMALHGIGRNDLIEMPQGEQPADNLTSVIEGTADVAFLPGGDPKPYLVEAMKTRALRIIPMTPEEQAATMPRGYLPIMLPGGMYPDHPNPIPVFTSGLGPSAVWTGLPDDLVYEITKAIFGHLDQVVATYAGFKEFTPQYCSDSTYLRIPAHPGAVKYLTEVKLWSDKDVKINDELLAKLKSKL